MTAAAIARALDGYATVGWSRCPCPVHGGSSPTLALYDGPHGLLVKCHAGCRREDVITELRRRGLLEDGAKTAAPADPAEITRQRAATDRGRRQRTADALDFWQHETTPAEDTVVARYWAARGLAALLIPRTIRASASWLHHPSGGHRPAMIALVEHVEQGPVAIHRTWLQIDGAAKASFSEPRMSLGPVGGGAVRLAPAERTLVIGEGIETTASVMLAMGLPGWAALSAGGIGALILPPIVTNVIIAADHDPNGVGAAAADKAARRWLQEGRRVRIAMPPEVGSDFSDVLLGRSHACMTEARDAA